MKNVLYLKTKSATLLWFVKFLTGVIALYSIYYLAKTMQPVFQVIGNIGSSLNIEIQYLQVVFADLGLKQEFTKALVESITSLGSVDTLFIISFLAIMIYVIISPVLTVVDAIGATILRFKNGGTKLIKIVHTIYAAICLIMVLDFIISIVDVLVIGRKVGTAANALDVSVSAIIITVVVILAITAFVFLLLFCYHKDIVRAMTTINANISDSQLFVKKTHLSGISILFGVFMAVLLFCAISSEEKTFETWIGIIGIFGTMSKQFLVAANNRNVKKYNMQ